MKKKVKVHMLPTEDKDNYAILKSDNDMIARRTISITNLWKDESLYNLYFTSDEKIEEGDWYINSANKKDYINRSGNTRFDGLYTDCRKIVATTDKSLFIEILIGTNEDTLGVPINYEEVEEVFGKEYLSQIPQSFIKQYVEAGGKIDEVEVEIELKSIPVNKEMSIAGYITYHDLKLDSNNCVIVHSIEEKLYTVEDIKNFGLWLGQVPKKQKFRTIDSLFNEWNN